MCGLLLASVTGAADVPDLPEEPKACPAVLLGCSEAALRDAFGAQLQAEKIERRASARPQTVALPGNAVAATASTTVTTLAAALASQADSKDPFAEQQRLVRQPDDADVRRIEYELFRGRVYRVRWRLVERFERPLMASLVTHLTPKLGKPYYDQLIEAKFGSGRATLRRAGWRHQSRSLEVRQLNPSIGGPIFVTLSDPTVIRAILAAAGTVAPEPDSIGRWWTTPIKSSPPLTTQQRDALLVAFDTVLAQLDW